VIVPGDAAATAANIATSEWLFRLGVISDLTTFAIDPIVAVLLYVLLRPADRSLALVAASLRPIAHPAIASINVLNQFAALHLLVLGYLLSRSDLSPTVLGGLIVLAAVGYPTESLTFFLCPAYEATASSVVVVTAVVGEGTLALYLLVKGVRTPSTDDDVGGGLVES
jgi:hypothetical protein